MKISIVLLFWNISIQESVECKYANCFDYNVFHRFKEKSIPSYEKQ